MVRRWSVMNSGPVAQLSPMAKRSACDSEAAEASAVCPASMVPMASMVPETITEMRSPRSSRSRSIASQCGFYVACVLAGLDQQ